MNFVYSDKTPTINTLKKLNQKIKMKKILFVLCATMLFACCKSTKNTAGTASLESQGPNTVWTLKTMKNKIMAFGENDRIVTISFNAEAGQVGGCSGCNTYFGGYSEPKLGKLEFQPIMATKMACPQPMMDTERTFLSTLRKVNGYQIAEDGLLQLLQDETVVLTFEKQEKTE